MVPRSGVWHGRWCLFLERWQAGQVQGPRDPGALRGTVMVVTFLMVAIATTCAPAAVPTWAWHPRVFTLVAEVRDRWLP